MANIGINIDMGLDCVLIFFVLYHYDSWDCVFSTHLPNCDMGVGFNWAERWSDE